MTNSTNTTNINMEIDDFFIVGIFFIYIIYITIIIPLWILLDNIVEYIKNQFFKEKLI